MFSEFDCSVDLDAAEMMFPSTLTSSCRSHVGLLFSSEDLVS